MKLTIRNRVAALGAIALLAGLQAGTAEARGGASDLRSERSYATASQPAGRAADRQQAAIKDSAASDADALGGSDREWFNQEKKPERENSLLKRRRPFGR